MEVTEGCLRYLGVLACLDSNKYLGPLTYKEKCFILAQVLEGPIHGQLAP